MPSIYTTAKALHTSFFAAFGPTLNTFCAVSTSYFATELRHAHLVLAYDHGPVRFHPVCGRAAGARCSANQGSKRQRAEQGEASVDAYLAQLGQEPQQQLLQQQHAGVMQDLDRFSGGCDSGEAAGGHGSLVAAMRTRSLTAFDDDVDEDSPAGPGNSVYTSGHACQGSRCV